MMTRSVKPNTGEDSSFGDLRLSLFRAIFRTMTVRDDVMMSIT